MRSLSETPAFAIDVVVVSYNSHGRLKECVQPLCALPGVRVVVVDNCSADDSLAEVHDLPLETIRLERNRGFAHGVNRGAAVGDAPFVLLLNPDARIDEQSLRNLVETLAADQDLGAAAPRIVAADGALEFSQRRFPRLRSTFARALFLHRLFPRATWTDELVRDEAAYARPGSPDWVSGACLLVRRSLLADLGGLDDGFFMYCEDIDLCRRMREVGAGIRFDPCATVRHEGGASAPRSELLPVLTASRIRYASKHRSRLGALAERLGLALEAATHIAVSRGGRAARAGHARALVAALRPAKRTN